MSITNHNVQKILSNYRIQHVNNGQRIKYRISYEKTWNIIEISFMLSRSILDNRYLERRYLIINNNRTLRFFDINEFEKMLVLCKYLGAQLATGNERHL